MKPSTIYREAARAIAEGEQARSCVAIEAAQGLDYYSPGGVKSPACEAYVDLILGGEKTTNMLFPVDPDKLYVERVKADAAVRVLALLLMAEIAADAERSLTRCPNCGGSVKNHPQNGCALAVLIGVIQDRGTVAGRTLTELHARVDPDALWQDLGKLVDRLENGDYNT